MLRRTQILIFMVVCFHASRCKDVIGYTGEPVVLMSGIDQKLNLVRIRWSIYENSTFIATFQGGKKDVDRWPPFAGRLDLNTTSGNLTIKNVNASDSMKYTVSWKANESSQSYTSSVYLFVREQLQKPRIIRLHNFLDAGKCVLSLKCSSRSSNISLIWKSEDDFDEDLFPKNSNRESVMWTSLKTNKDVIFSCIATDGNRSESTQWSGKCPVPEEIQSDCTGMFFLGFFVCFFIAVILIILIRKHKKGFCP